MPIDLATIEVQRLKATDDVREFTTSDADVENFLKVIAWTYQEEQMGVSFLARLETQLVGYFTLSAARIRVKQVETRDQVEDLQEMEYYPALLIGQLAVGKPFEKQGIGSRLLQIIYGIATGLQDRVGVRFLVLNSTPASLAWWTKRGFTALRSQRNRKLPFLYLDIRKMER